MQELTTIQQVIVLVPPVLLAITLHEVAHGWAALHFGDPTAQSQGRLSLNPIRHIDPVGTILVPGLLFLSGTGFLFGWAKPVPVNYRRLRNPQRDMALVSLAGPAANIVMAILWALLLNLAIALADSQPAIAAPLGYMSTTGIIINVLLAVLNMLPVPPLDGSKVLAGFLPAKMALALLSLERFAFVIFIGLMVLMATGVLGSILGPPVQFVKNLIVSTFVFY
jgi:Zn-dependent protease